MVLVEDDPPDHDRNLLGLYVGTPLTSRDSGYTMVAPDRITIFRNPILAICGARTSRGGGAVTVVHEIAHHFGIDDDRLHELGYG